MGQRDETLNGTKVTHMTSHFLWVLKNDTWIRKRPPMMKPFEISGVGSHLCYTAESTTSTRNTIKYQLISKQK